MGIGSCAVRRAWNPPEPPPRWGDLHTTRAPRPTRRPPSIPPTRAQMAGAATTWRVSAPRDQVLLALGIVGLCGECVGKGSASVGEAHETLGGSLPAGISGQRGMAASSLIRPLTTKSTAQLKTRMCVCVRRHRYCSALSPGGGCCLWPLGLLEDSSLWGRLQWCSLIIKKNLGYTQSWRDSSVHCAAVPWHRSQDSSESFLASSCVCELVPLYHRACRADCMHKLRRGWKLFSLQS